MGRVYNDIIEGFTLIPDSIFRNIYRQVNDVAHNLAKFILIYTASTSWETIPP